MVPSRASRGRLGSVGIKTLEVSQSRREDASFDLPGQVTTECRLETRKVEARANDESGSRTHQRDTPHAAKTLYGR